MIAHRLAAIAVLLFGAAAVSAQREFENTGMHCKGEGITDLMQWDHAQCSAYCDVREDCFGYVFNLKDNFTCILKGKTCEMSPSEVWRFYRKPGAVASASVGKNSDWNADSAHSASQDHGYDLGGPVEDDVVNGPPGNMGNSFTKRDFHCAGKNMGNGEPWSLGECAAQCMRNERCIGFIRLITGDQQCILKEAGCTKKPPTVWVFYEKTDNGEVLPDGPAGELGPMPSQEIPAAGSPVSADAAGGYGGLGPRIDEHFADTQQHCKGGVISNEMRGHDQCSRACLDAPDCIGYSIASREPFQCYLKSKECELAGHHPLWTFVKKKDLFREMRAVRCIKFAEEYGATSAEQCKQMCLERETFCVGVSFRSGSCKLITSFDCGGWQIFKKLAEDQQNAAAAAGHQQAWQAAGVPETASPSMIDLSADHAGEHSMGSDMGLNDAMPNADALIYFQKLGGNCPGGVYLGDVYGSEADCAAQCHRDSRCRGFSYIKVDQRCALKADACTSPTVLNSAVNFWFHLSRQ